MATSPKTQRQGWGFNRECMGMFQLASEIFREYDIRGQYPLKLNEKVAHLIGQALGSEILLAGQHSCYVAWDGRLSSPSLKDAFVSGLCSTGCDALLIGQAPTAAAFWAIKQNKLSCAVITGSHNPKQDNGIKIAVAGTARSGDDIQVLRSRIELNLFETGQGKVIHAEHILQAYQAALVEHVQLQRPLKIVLDSGNGVGGPTALKAFESIGAQLIPIACKVDGEFPLHHPDPAKTKNLKWLQEAVVEQEADIGIALDGDADRIGVVDNLGDVVLPDRVSLIFVEDILKHQPGATCVFDVKCTAVLADVITDLGGQPKMIATGHTSMKKVVRETQAPFATELSGHILFNDQHGLGVDDGIYAALRLCELVSQSPRPLSERLAQYRQPVATEEIQLPVADKDKFSIMKFIAARGFQDTDKILVDGLRIQWPHGWALVRASNTTPCLTLRFEADNVSRLQSIQQMVMAELHRLVPQIPNSLTSIKSSQH